MRSFSFLVTLTFIQFSIAKEAQLSQCQNFVSNDQGLSNYLVLTPDCKINPAGLAAVKKNNPNMTYEIAPSDAAIGTDKLTVPDGLAVKNIILHRKAGQLVQIDVSRSVVEFNQSGLRTFKIMNTYTFDCSSGDCAPRIGMEYIGAKVNNSPQGSITVHQLFDVSLCKKLKSFFKANPKAAACMGDFEKKSADLLKDYEGDRTNYTGYIQPSGNFGPSPFYPTLYGGSFNIPLFTVPNPTVEDLKKNPPSSSVLSKPANDSKLALAMSLNNDCANDRRIAAAINETSNRVKKAAETATK
ncbi:MAG: hypothetical protein SGJ18_01120 [Pseudomonadota bacterium]|nr:hypothetical protein [Pseudomonadota bacterium]